MCVTVDAVDTKKGGTKLSERKTFRASEIPLTSLKICVQMRLAVVFGHVLAKVIRFLEGTD